MFHPPPTPPQTFVNTPKFQIPRNKPEGVARWLQWDVNRRTVESCLVDRGRLTTRTNQPCWVWHVVLSLKVITICLSNSDVTFGLVIGILFSQLSRQGSIDPLSYQLVTLLNKSNII